MKKTKQVRFRVTPEQMAKLGQVAEITRRSRSNVLRYLIDLAEATPPSVTTIVVPPTGEQIGCQKSGNRKREEVERSIHGG